MIEDNTARAVALGVVDQLCAQADDTGSQILHPAARDQIAAILANSIRANGPPFSAPMSIELYRAIAELTTNGVVKFDGLLSADQVAEIRRHLEPHPVYDKWIAALSE